MNSRLQYKINIAIKDFLLYNRVKKIWRTIMKRIIALLLLAVISVSCFAACSEDEKQEGFVYDQNKNYKAEIIIEDYGSIHLTFDSKQAPITVENFVTLAANGFYDGLTFHRIINGFMMQGGDPNGNGTGGAEKDIVGEFTANGHQNNISHKRGVISMARAKAYNSASSQFFIMHQDYTGLDGQYAAFGYVTDGMSVVDKICTEAMPIDSNGTIPASKQPVIEKIKITWDE